MVEKFEDKEQFLHDFKSIVILENTLLDLIIKRDQRACMYYVPVSYGTKAKEGSKGLKFMK